MRKDVLAVMSANLKALQDELIGKGQLHLFDMGHWLDVAHVKENCGRHFELFHEAIDRYEMLRREECLIGTDMSGGGYIEKLEEKKIL